MSNDFPTTYWHVLKDGRLQCDLCPNACKLKEEQRGICFLRQRKNNQIVLTHYGEVSGIAIDPIEKNHCIILCPAVARFRLALSDAISNVNSAKTGTSAKPRMIPYSLKPLRQKQWRDWRCNINVKAWRLRIMNRSSH